MSLETLIKTVFSDDMRKEMWQELSAGKLLTPQFKKNVQFGDEIDVQFHDVVEMNDYTGGDLEPTSAKTAGLTTVKVKINKGKSVFFKLDEAKIRQIESARTNEQKVMLVREYSSDAKEQFARAINKACCEQFTRAGNIITTDGKGTAITTSSDNIIKILAKAKQLLKQGDGKGHTAWKDGEMIAIVSTGMEAFMSTQNLLQYSDVMAKHYRKGFAGSLMGFNIIVDDDIAHDDDGNEYPLFGRQGKTLAGGIQDDFTLRSGVPVGGFDTRYWGKGVFGVKAPLTYLLCSAKLKTDFKVS